MIHGLARDQWPSTKLQINQSQIDKGTKNPKFKLAGYIFDKIIAVAKVLTEKFLKRQNFSASMQKCFFYFLNFS